MTTIYANKRNVLPLGRCGENLTRQIVFDISNWESLYGVGTAELIYQRPTDERPYIMEITRENSRIHWEITAWHTAVEDGYGKCELRYYVADVLKKSRTWSTRVDPALDTPSATLPPSAETGWVETVLQAASSAKSNAIAAEESAKAAKAAAEHATSGGTDAGSSGAVVNQIAAHNVSANAHNDIRTLIQGLTNRLHALANSDDTTLDQMHEIVSYIKDNRELITEITTDKISVSDIIDDLSTNISNKPLSASQGVVLKSLIDTLASSKLDATALSNAVDAALKQAQESGAFNGAPGYTPQKNIDYWTQEDQQTIVNDVLAALPVWEGGNY